MSRKLSSAILGLLFLIGACYFYGSVIESRRLIVTTIPISDGRLAQILSGRTVALLGDLHFGANGEPLAGAVLQKLDQIRPDLILLTGDYVEWGSREPAYEHALTFLSRLQAPLGIFAILGEADRTFSRKSCEFCHQARSGDLTKRHNVTFLSNEARPLDLSGSTCRIVGVERGFSGQAELKREILGDGTPTIVLSHSSAVYRGIDPTQDILMLSGDTHGGQVRLPRWFWRLTRFKPDPEHLQGYFNDGRKSLVVTRGVGTSHVRFRLGVPPEIVVLRFIGGAR